MAQRAHLHWPPHERPDLQRQSAPQRQFSLQPQPRVVTLERKVFKAVNIGISVDWVLRFVRLGHGLPKPTAHRALERNGYDISSAAAGSPNIRLNVRLRWAESEKPACCAASVRFAPCACASTARTRRNHRT